MNPLKPGVNLDAWEGYTVPAPLKAPYSSYKHSEKS